MKTLVVLTGPTGVGKTELSLRIAESLGSPILNCDSRQLYKELQIGTAAPTLEQQQRVRHFFVGCRSIHDPYSAAKYEIDVLERTAELFRTHDKLLLTGGSMMYLDAVCKGIDDMPDIVPEIRNELQKQYNEQGLAPLLDELERLDPIYYTQVDRQNPKRVLHGLEVCRQTGQPFSTFRKDTAKKRPFVVQKICLDRDRNELYQRIDERVLQMMNDGLEAEAKGLLPYKHLNALNTVGYKELFECFEGACSLNQAVTNIQFNTHKYARKQLTWFRKDKDYRWFNAENPESVLDYLIL